MTSQPPRRNLESLKKEAKRWRDALLANDADALARLQRIAPGRRGVPTLRDVQHALAREQGFEGWASLKHAVEQGRPGARDIRTTGLAVYESMAEALLEAYRTGTPDAMERHYRYTWHRRAWQTMRTYVQLDLGKRPASPDEDVAITLDDARHLVALEHGFANWEEVRAFAERGGLGPRTTAKPLSIVVRTHPDDWQTVGRSRDWDEILALLAELPAPALNAAGQMTDHLLEDVAAIGQLTGLDLSGSQGVTDAGLHHLARLPVLQHLDLSGTAVTDAGLAVLRSLPRLRTISLAWTRISDAGAGWLRYCGDLEEVNLSGTAAGDGALQALAGKARLRRLAIALSDEGLPLLHELPVFKTWHGGEARLGLLGHPLLPNDLTLRGTFTDAGMAHLRGLDGLYALGIDDSAGRLTAAAMAPLVSLASLGVLRVDARDDWMPYIAEMPHLRALAAQDTVAGDDGFVALSRSRSIEYLWGRRCHNLRTRGFLALADMPALRALAVSYLNVSDEAVAALPAFPALRELMPMDVPDAGYRHIGRCGALEALVLMYCRETTDAATGHITSLRNLSYYFNSYTRITDRTPELLATIDSLERITFDTCHGLTDAGVGRLARLPKLRELRVSGGAITPAVRRFFPARISVLSET